MDTKYHLTYSAVIMMVILFALLIIWLVTKNKSTSEIPAYQREAPSLDDLILYYDVKDKVNKYSQISELKENVNLSDALSSLNSITPIPTDSIVFTNATNSFTTSNIYDFGRNLLKSNIGISGGDMIFALTPSLFSKTPSSVFGRSLLGVTSISSLQTLLNLNPDINIQSYSSKLASIASLTLPANKILYTSDTNIFSTSSITDYARTNILTATSGSDLTALVDGITGPGSSTDNAITRFNGTSGSLVQNSSVTIDDSGNITIPGTITFGGGNTVDGYTAECLARLNTYATDIINVWEFLIHLDQDVSSSASPIFSGLLLNGDLSMSDNSITDVAAPSNPNDAANKAYVDAVSSGSNVGYFGPAKYATTTNLSVTQTNVNTLTASSNGVLSVDGYNPSVGDKIVVKDQSTSSQNGFFTVSVSGTLSTQFVLVRSTGYTSSNNTNFGTTRYKVFITHGSTNSGTGWISSILSTPSAGVDAFTFTQISEQIGAGNGLVISGTQYNIETPNLSGGIYINSNNQVDIYNQLSIAKGGTNNTSFTTGKITYYDGTKLLSSSISESTLLSTTNTKSLTNKTLSDTTNDILVDKLYYKSDGTSSAITISNTPSAANQILQVYQLSPLQAKWQNPSIDITSLTALTSPANDDYFPVYDTSATSNKKISYQNLINAVSVSLPKGTDSNPFIVAPTNGDYASLHLLFDYLINNYTSATPVTVHIYPGNYSDNADIFTSNGASVTIIGLGNVYLTGTYTIENTDYVTIENVTFINPGTNHSININYNEGRVTLNNIRFQGAITSNYSGILVQNSSSLYVNNFSYTSLNITQLFEVKEGCQLFINNLVVSNAGSCTSLIYSPDTSLSEINIFNLLVENSDIVYVFDINQNAQLKGSNIRIKDVTNCIYVRDDANIIEFHAVNFSGSNSDLLIENFAGNSSSTNNITISGIYHIIYVPTNYGGIFNLNKIDKTNNSHTIYGKLEVGNQYSLWPDGSSELVQSFPTYLGSGSSKPQYMMKYDGTSTYTTVSTTSFVGFSGVTAGNILYIGSNSPIYALEVKPSVVINLGSGAIICEIYSDSLGWIESKLMSLKSYSTNTDTSSDTRLTNPFSSTDGSIVRLDFTSMTDHVSSVVNSITKYWIRFRITSTITTSPTLSYLKCIPNSLLVESNGSISKFGVSEELVHKNLLVNYLDGATSSTISLSSNINAIGYLIYDSSQSITYQIDPEYYMDTSRPITLEFKYYFNTISTTQVVKLELTYISPNDNTITIGATPTESTSINTLSTSGKTEKQVYTTTFTIYCNQIVNPKVLYIRLGRNSTGDTYTGNFIIYSSVYKFYKYR